MRSSSGGWVINRRLSPLLRLPEMPKAAICSGKCGCVLDDQHFPHVLIDHRGVDTNSPAVGCTNWQGAYEATEYLINLGHQRIGFITGLMEMGSAQDRLGGYIAALRAHHISETPELIFEGDFFQNSGVVAANALLDLPEQPTAILASNDVMAMAERWTPSATVVCVFPMTFPLLGSMIFPTAVVYPPLTTVRQPLEQMGRVATQALLKMLTNPEKRITYTELQTELIVRSSTCRHRDGAG